MHTNIVIDDALLEEAQRESGLPSKRAVVEAGLSALIREQRRRRLSAAFGRYVWEGDLAKMREGSPLDKWAEDRAPDPHGPA